MSKIGLLNKHLTLEEHKSLTIKDLEKLILESCFSEIFLNRVLIVFKLNSHRDALSLIWSSGIKKVINQVAVYYFNQYKKYKTSDQSKRRNKLKEKDINKYNSIQKETLRLTKKAYYNRQGENKIIEKTKKRLDYLDLETLEYEKKDINRFMVDLKKYKDKIHKIILVIRK